jgi:methyl-accepting chemotaxis protein
MDHVGASHVYVLKVRLGLWRALAKKEKVWGSSVRDSSALMKKEWDSYYSSGVKSSDERAVADKIEELMGQFRSAVDKELEFIDQGDFDQADTWQEDNVIPLSAKLTEQFAKAIQINADHARDNDTNGAAQAARLKRISASLMVAGTMLSIVAALYLARAVTGPLNRMVHIASAIAQGRLDGKIVVDATGEFGKLLEAMKTMNGQLAGTIQGIRDSSESVSVAAGQITTGNQDLSARTEQQAAALQQTTASMSQLTERVNQNTGNARQANSLAANAREMTGAGHAAVGAMVATMQEISTGSTKIADITGMIEAIAFQTNILALNAAVEAARAGEQGRGFAVVASEVRALAQRTAAAVKDIKELIEVSSDKVHKGSRQAGDVGATMNKVMQAISQVSDIVGEISAASDEQSKDIHQVHQAINQIDEMTQQNAALVEEATAAAQSLQNQAAKMKGDVMFFKLGEESLPYQRFAIEPSPQRANATKTTVRPLSVKAVVTPVVKRRELPQLATAGDQWEEF